jgi:hypothetical protein
MFMLSTIGCVILLVLLGLVVAAINHKRWVMLGSGIALCGAAVLANVYAMNVAEHRRIVSSQAQYAETQRLIQLEKARTDYEKTGRWSTDSFASSPQTNPEVTSDEELAAVASAQPKIKLEEVSVPVEVVDVQINEEDATDDAADVKRDRPDWIDAHLGDNQKLITSGPFTTKDSCEADTQKQIVEWLRSRHEHLVWPNGTAKFPGADVTQLIKSQHEELRDTSVGEMHLLYTLAEVNPEFEAKMAQSLAAAAAQVAQKRGVRTITFAGAGVLSLVALAHVVLKSGGRKAKNSAP